MGVFFIEFKLNNLIIDRCLGDNLAINTYNLDNYLLSKDLYSINRIIERKI